jgi:hypothetical protein
MLELLLSLRAAVRVFFRGRAEAPLRASRSASRSRCSSANDRGPTLTRLDRVFWSTLRHVWPRWPDVLLIVNRRPWSGGIAPASASTGAGDHGTAGAGRRSPRRCRPSSPPRDGESDPGCPADSRRTAETRV